MSEVILNRIGVDHVNFNLTTSGSHTAACTLNDLLLDPTLEYIIRVSELNAPMSVLPLFGYAPDGTNALNKELFRIKQRLPGHPRALFLAANTAANPNPAETNPAAGAGSPGFASNFNTVGAGGVNFVNPGSFISALGKAANNFSQNQDYLGADPEGDVQQNGLPQIDDDPNIGAPDSNSEYLKIRLNADGVVEIIGTSLFWNNFCIQFSDYGKILLGISDEFLDANNIMSVTRLTGGALIYDMFVAVTGNVIDLTGVGYEILDETVRITGSYPLFRNLEHRYFVSVETDLLVSQTTRVTDGKQQIDRSICKVFFPTRCKVLLESENGVLREDVDFEIETPVGQHSFVKKTEPSRQWTALQTSYDLRFYRFHLYVTYRVLDDSNKWRLVQMKYPITQDDSWSLGLEFVSKV